MATGYQEGRGRPKPTTATLEDDLSGRKPRHRSEEIEVNIRQSRSPNPGRQLVRFNKSLASSKNKSLSSVPPAATSAYDERLDSDRVGARDDSRARRQPPSRSRGHIADKPKTPSRAWKHIQAVYNPDGPKDVTVRLELPISEDLDLELEEFARLGRMGDFKGAQEYFNRHLGGHLANPYVFIQYAEMLLEMGDFNQFASLKPGLALSTEASEPIWPAAQDPRGDTTDDDEVGDHHQVGRPHQSRELSLHKSRSTNLSLTQPRKVTWEDEEKSKDHVDGPLAASRDRTRQARSEEHDELELLRWNWRLLHALAQVHLNQPLQGLESEFNAALRELSFGPEIGSTEVRIISLVMRICFYIKNYKNYQTEVFITQIAKWVDFPGLYRSLLSQGRVWDFRDLVRSAVSVFGFQHWEKLTGGQITEGILEDFAHDMDEVTCLALLDILVSNTLYPGPTTNNTGIGAKSSPLDAQFLAESIMGKYPTAMRSRTFMRWILTQAVESGCTDKASPGAWQHLFQYLEGVGGFLVEPNDLVNLPLYLPERSIIPLWEVQDFPTETNKPVQLVLNLAKELADYPTQALCYKLLLLRSQDPTPLFEELSYLQKTVQGDRHGYLETCLSKFIGCTEAESQKRLLEELADFDGWIDSADMRDPVLYCARDIIRLSLNRVLGRQCTPSSLGLSPANMHYYAELPALLRRFVRYMLHIDKWPAPASSSALPRIGKEYFRGFATERAKNPLDSDTSYSDEDDDDEPTSGADDIEHARTRRELERIREELRQLKKVVDNPDRQREERRLDLEYEGRLNEKEREKLELALVKGELEEIKLRQASEEREKRIRREMELEMLEREWLEAKKREEHKRLRDAAITEWKAKEYERAEEKRNDDQRDNRDYATRLRDDLLASGVEQHDVEAILRKPGIKGGKEMNEKLPHRTVWTRLALDRIDVDTLNHFKIDFEYDSKDPGYVFVRRPVPGWELNRLREHSRNIRIDKEDTKQPSPASVSLSTAKAGNACDIAAGEESGEESPELETGSDILSSSSSSSSSQEDAEGLENPPMQPSGLQDRPQNEASSAQTVAADSYRHSLSRAAVEDISDSGVGDSGVGDSGVGLVVEDMHSTQGLDEERSAPGVNSVQPEQKSEAANEAHTIEYAEDFDKVDDTMTPRMLHDTAQKETGHDGDLRSDDGENDTEAASKPLDGPPKTDRYRAIRATLLNSGEGSPPRKLKPEIARYSSAGERAHDPLYRQQSINMNSTGIWDSWEEVTRGRVSKTQPSYSGRRARDDSKDGYTSGLEAERHKLPGPPSAQRFEDIYGEVREAADQPSGGSSGDGFVPEPRFENKQNEELGKEAARPGVSVTEKQPDQDSISSIYDEPGHILPTVARFQEEDEQQGGSLSQAYEGGHKAQMLKPYRRPTVDEVSDAEDEPLAQGKSND